MIPFCVLQWSWLRPGIQHGTCHRGLALGLQGEFITSTREPEPFAVKFWLRFGLMCSGCWGEQWRGFLFLLGRVQCFCLALVEWRRYRGTQTAARARADVPLTPGHTWNGCTAVFYGCIIGPWVCDQSTPCSFQLDSSKIRGSNPVSLWWGGDIHCPSSKAA